MEHHTIKKEKSLEYLRSVGIENVVVFNAVDGKKLNIDGLDNVSLFTKYLINNPIKRSSHEQINSPGGVGCFMSHLACWKELVKSNKSVAFIFEDDLRPEISFEKDFEDSFQKLPSDFDMFSFGYLVIRGKPQKTETGLKTGKLFFGLQGYLITKNGAKKLIKYADVIESQVDSFISFIAHSTDFKLYFSPNSLVRQDNITGTSIQETNWKCNLPDTWTGFAAALVFLILIIIIIYLVVGPI